ncbi:MAG: dihydropteroate synthase, partial [Muribaculaceae bacterium]|nr:dihydropteroate synthase [Muribaculaceae bacterium]
LEIALGAVRAAVGDEVPVSVDTFRADVARRCVREWGADIVNDISGGKLDSNMFATVADLRCPYILMHMRGTPATMQTMTDYADVTADVISELSRSLWQLAELGVADVIVDPGFGFAKTLEQNYEMMARLGAFDILDRPLLVGVSRKSMLTRLLGIDASDALVPTAVLGAYALDRGASILRVHDVLAARQSVTIFEQLQSVNH